MEPWSSRAVAEISASMFCVAADPAARHASFAALSYASFERSSVVVGGTPLEATAGGARGGATGMAGCGVPLPSLIA